MNQKSQSEPEFELEEVKVLDHGFIALVDKMGSDLSIVRSARISRDAKWRDEIEGDDTSGSEGPQSKDAKLIHSLMRRRHTTPFECVTFTFEVKAPIFVFRQWHRHRTQSYNELSARYSELSEEYYVPKPEVIGIQSETDKQSRNIGTSRTVEEWQTLRRASDIIRRACCGAFYTYHQLLKEGVPRELARGVLPVNTYSRMFATINLWNIFHFLGLRQDKHAQWEIRQYAHAMGKLIRPHIPIAYEAYLENTPAEIE